MQARILFWRCQLAGGDQPGIVQLFSQSAQSVLFGEGGQVGENIQDPLILHRTLFNVG
jgi:hypothetical protein